MPLVVDASIALAWALPDESNAYADTVLTVVERDGLRVPELWAREIANGLAVAYQRNRLTFADENAFLAALSRLSIEIDAVSPLKIIREGTEAARRYGLTAYDAAYVNLAARMGCPSPRSTGRCATQRNKQGSSFLDSRTGTLQRMMAPRSTFAKRSRPPASVPAAAGRRDEAASFVDRQLANFGVITHARPLTGTQKP